MKEAAATETTFPDFSEWLDGPALIALRGNDDPASAYRLGTREYDWHTHARGQVLCVEAGLIHVHTPHGAWLLPPRRAGWVPPGAPHRVQVSGAPSGWALLASPAFCAGLPARPCVIGVSEVLRALAYRAIDWDKQAALAPEHERMAAVIHDEIRRAPREALHVPMPGDPRLARVARAILDEPGSPRTLDAWAAFGTMSPRTLRRLMMAETGLSFAQWRQQARLAHGLDMLARGRPVAEVSDALGYASPSNFIAMFRKALGDSPAHYFSRRANGQPD
ncbi:AraC family transcriptional regulator [Burkholderia ubonensis]|uniref:AraC family transcriptional regulator n=1 Tax=Burkholderia ubonensis TaxID=101571 RepID=UPI00075AE971|nr:helix-turn-helix transcriptional regulator [Burkholderia ubonensis]KVA09628.1 AraC family transcriptional regulator [Burkholderia ubonensis]KVA29942.1 AraC family transcriptional regulator [Burkholderia ubonensis]KVA48089.1 AraC family transcriptional regulator [Burkholderia ubonensis]